MIHMGFSGAVAFFLIRVMKVYPVGTCNSIHLKDCLLFFFAGVAIVLVTFSHLNDFGTNIVLVY